jgi:dTDP-4-amino-4,6-dideoxygalactose transaminase
MENTKQALEVGQYGLPSWEALEAIAHDIFDREYYTNHGPLAQRFEARLAEILGVKHAVCMTNANIGLMIASKALDLRGRVAIPAFSPPAVSQALVWAGLAPAYCPVSDDTLHLSPEALDALLQADRQISAVLGVHLFDGCCGMDAIEQVAQKHGVPVYYYNLSNFGGTYQGKGWAQFGDMTIFSLEEKGWPNAGDGCVIATQNDHWAARLRNIRSSYGAGTTVPIPFTGNGRMSEIQAGIGLASLDDFSRMQAHSQALQAACEEQLQGIQGLELYRPEEAVKVPFAQHAVLRIWPEQYGMTAVALAQSLRPYGISAQTFEHYGVLPHPSAPPQLPLERLYKSAIELPFGWQVKPEHIAQMGQLLQNICGNATA